MEKDNSTDRNQEMELINTLGEVSFFESAPLSREVEMYWVVKSISLEERRRKTEGIQDASKPMRPDHGLEMLDVFIKNLCPAILQLDE